MAGFKVIIVGGGPVGLIAAHILYMAGIDIVLLEKYHTVTPEPGSSLVIWPQTVRILDQLRILDSLEPIMNPLEDKTVLTHKGEVYLDNSSFLTTKLL
jgi:2-polyprenyl-6-methoxyphenol hydroxylase-like FAD-dependent oxidoreductase